MLDWRIFVQDPENSSIWADQKARFWAVSTKVDQNKKPYKSITWNRSIVHFLYNSQIPIFWYLAKRGVAFGIPDRIKRTRKFWRFFSHWSKAILQNSMVSCVPMRKWDLSSQPLYKNRFNITLYCYNYIIYIIILFIIYRSTLAQSRAQIYACLRDYWSPAMHHLNRHEVH